MTEQATREALEMAVKAMKSFQNGTNGLYEGEFESAIKACEEALQSNEHVEPVACTDEMCACRGGPCASCPDGAYEKTIMDAQPKEPEQEPVAAECKFDTEASWGKCSIEHHNLVHSEPEKWPKYQTRLLYTTPQKRKPLTDEQIEAIWVMTKRDYINEHQICFARELEAAQGIKGTA